MKIAFMHMQIETWQMDEWIYERTNQSIMNEWMNEWMNDWMNEWVNEWMNEEIKEGIKDGFDRNIFIGVAISYNEYILHFTIF